MNKKSETSQPNWYYNVNIIHPYLPEHNLTHEKGVNCPKCDHIASSNDGLNKHLKSCSKGKKVVKNPRLDYLEPVCCKTQQKKFLTGLRNRGPEWFQTDCIWV